MGLFGRGRVTVLVGAGVDGQLAQENGRPLLLLGLAEQDMGHFLRACRQRGQLGKERQGQGRKHLRHGIQPAAPFVGNAGLAAPAGSYATTIPAPFRPRTAKTANHCPERTNRTW